MMYTLKLHLPSKLYQQLKDHATRQNKPIEELALQLLQKELKPEKSDWNEDPLVHADTWAPSLVKGAPEDLAEGHDYYAYGGSKRYRRK